MRSTQWAPHLASSSSLKNAQKTMLSVRELSLSMPEPMLSLSMHELSLSMPEPLLSLSMLILAIHLVVALDVTIRTQIQN